MINIYKRWKYRYSKLEYTIDNNEIENDIIKNYNENPMYDPRDGWWWCINRNFMNSYVYGIGRTIKEAYDDVKEVEIIHLEINKELEENKMNKQLIGNSLYLEDWACGWNNELVENPFEAMKKDFKSDSSSWNNGSSKEEIKDTIEIIIAYYSYEDYYGDALVIYKDDNKLYEVTGSHCSCYGLEGQWEPEEINEEYLIHKIKEGKWVYHSNKANEVINEHLIKVLDLKGERE